MLQPEASSPRVITAVNAEIDRLKRDYPGIDFRVAYDNSHFVGILMKNMGEELAIAILLTGIAVLFFLGNWRGTLIAVVDSKCEVPMGSVPKSNKGPP